MPERYRARATPKKDGELEFPTSEILRRLKRIFNVTSNYTTLLWWKRTTTTLWSCWKLTSLFLRLFLKKINSSWSCKLFVVATLTLSDREMNPATNTYRFPLIFWCRFDSFSWFAGLVSAKELKNAPLCRANIAYNISKAQLQRIRIKKVMSFQRLTFFLAGHGNW